MDAQDDKAGSQQIKKKRFTRARKMAKNSENTTSSKLLCNNEGNFISSSQPIIGQPLSDRINRMFSSWKPPIKKKKSDEESTDLPGDNQDSRYSNLITKCVTISPMKCSDKAENNINALSCIDLSSPENTADKVQKEVSLTRENESSTLDINQSSIATTDKKTENGENNESTKNISLNLQEEMQTNKYSTLGNNLNDEMISISKERLQLNLFSNKQESINESYSLQNSHTTQLLPSVAHITGPEDEIYQKTNLLHRDEQTHSNALNNSIFCDFGPTAKCFPSVNNNKEAVNQTLQLNDVEDQNNVKESILYKHNIPSSSSFHLTKHVDISIEPPYESQSLTFNSDLATNKSSTSKLSGTSDLSSNPKENLKFSDHDLILSESNNSKIINDETKETENETRRIRDIDLPGRYSITSLPQTDGDSESFSLNNCSSEVGNKGKTEEFQDFCFTKHLENNVDKGKIMDGFKHMAASRSNGAKDASMDLQNSSFGLLNRPENIEKRVRFVSNNETQMNVGSKFAIRENTKLYQNLNSDKSEISDNTEYKFRSLSHVSTDMSSNSNNQQNVPFGYEIDTFNTGSQSLESHSTEMDNKVMFPNKIFCPSVSSTKSIDFNTSSGNEEFQNNSDLFQKKNAYLGNHAIAENKEEKLFENSQNNKFKEDILLMLQEEQKENISSCSSVHTAPLWASELKREQSNCSKQIESLMSLCTGTFRKSEAMMPTHKDMKGTLDDFPARNTRIPAINLLEQAENNRQRLKSITEELSRINAVLVRARLELRNSQHKQPQYQQRTVNNPSISAPSTVQSGGVSQCRVPLRQFGQMGQLTSTQSAPIPTTQRPIRTPSVQAKLPRSWTRYSGLQKRQ